MGAAMNHLTHHNNWANSELVGFLEGLPEDRLDRSEPGTFGAIRATLVHLVAAEATYVVGATAEEPADRVHGSSGWPGFQPIRRSLWWSGPHLVRIAENANDEAEVPRVYQGRLEPVRLATFLVQAVHHGQEHRTNITTILAAGGIEAPDLSGWMYSEVTWG